MRRKGTAARVAYPAVLGAVSLILVYIASVVPTGNWGLVAVAGVLAVPVGALLRKWPLWSMSIAHAASNYVFYFLLGWLPETIKKGEALDRETRDKERKAEKQKEDWLESGDPRGHDPVPRDPKAVRADSPGLLSNQKTSATGTSAKQRSTS